MANFKTKIVKIAVVIFVINLIIHLLTWVHDKTSTDSEQVVAINPPWRAAMLNSTLDYYRDADRNILIAYVEYGVIDLAINLYETSIKRFKIRNYLFLSSDELSCTTLKSKGIHCLHYIKEVMGGGRPSSFRSESFNVKTQIKNKIVLDSLLLRYSVLLTDLDVVFLQNPLPFITKLGKSFDVVFQNNTNEVNTGFYYAKPTKYAINLFRKAWNESFTVRGLNWNDQRIIAMLLKKPESSKIKVHYLDKKLFQVGKTYWEDSMIFFNLKDPWARPEAVVVHNNWMMPKAAKIYRFKESLMWYNDDAKYYSDPRRKYIMYTNPFVVGNVKGVELERDGLINALSIGYLLNRTVILPKFHCYGSKDKICGTSFMECNMMVHFHLERFAEYFNDSYREHMFLSHPLVPKTTVKSVSDNMLIVSKAIREMNESQKQRGYPKRFFPKNGSAATVEEILKWFRKTRQRVLFFYSLYGAFTGFPDHESYKDIKERLEKGLHYSDYRQYSDIEWEQVRPSIVDNRKLFVKLRMKER